MIHVRKKFLLITCLLFPPLLPMNGMEAWARGEIICFVVCFWTVYFCYGRIVGTGACEWDLEDGNFFHRDCMIHMIIFFTLTWRHWRQIILFVVCFWTTYFCYGWIGKGGDYLFCSQFLEGIFLLLRDWQRERLFVL